MDTPSAKSFVSDRADTLGYLKSGAKELIFHNSTRSSESTKESTTKKPPAKDELGSRQG
jgi:hypothetical protein